MGDVTIDINEYKNLIKIQEKYCILITAFANAMEVRFAEWAERSAYTRLNDELLIEALKMIDKDGYEALYYQKFIEAQEKAEAEEEE